MAAEVDVPPWRFQVGSEWRAPSSDVAIKTFLEGRLSHETPYKRKFHVIRSNSKAYTIACCCVPKSSGAQKRKDLCSFVVHCVVKPDFLLVTECCLDHSCLTTAEPVNQPQRKRNPKFKTIMAGNEVLNAYAVSQKGGAAQVESLWETVRNISGLDINRKMAQIAVQQLRRDTFYASVMELLALESVLQKCRESDPLGVYLLETSSLTYQLPRDWKVVPGRMFVRLHVIPSAAMYFWKHSRRMIAADSAHLKSHFNGIVNMLTAKDANDHNLTLMYSICDQETKANWLASAFLAAELLFENEVSYWISDRNKGLEAIPVELENHFPGCLFASCALHIAQNVGLDSNAGRSIVTKMAKAGSEEEFLEFVDEFKGMKIFSDAKLNSLEQKKELFCLHAIKAKLETFFTHYGQVNSNAAEQQNNTLMDFRKLPILSGLMDLNDFQYTSNFLFFKK